jgi:hypothetical protein
MRKKNTQPNSMSSGRGSRAAARSATPPQPAVVTGRARGRGEAGE